MIQGGCFCRNIRYAIEDGDYPVVNCHCSICRKVSAAPFVTWVVVPKEVFAYTMGAPTVLNSSDKGFREFCPDCGTPLTFHDNKRTTHVDITTGSLDFPNDFVPTMAVHKDSKLVWLHTIK